MSPPDLSFFVTLERRVGQALADGDVKSDAELLDPGFMGVYASGFATKDDHVGQLRDGPRGANWVNVFSQDTVQLPATSPPGMESA